MNRYPLGEDDEDDGLEPADWGSLIIIGLYAVFAAASLVLLAAIVL